MNINASKYVICRTPAFGTNKTVAQVWDELKFSSLAFINSLPVIKFFKSMNRKFTVRKNQKENARCSAEEIQNQNEITFQTTKSCP